MEEIKHRKYRLPREFAGKWIEALESGEYKQARNYMVLKAAENMKTSYCCLGVAGKICGIPDKTLTRGVALYESYSKEATVIPLPKEIVAFHDSGLANECMGLNDKYKKSFKEIAQFIKTEVELY